MIGSVFLTNSKMHPRRTISYHAPLFFFPSSLPFRPPLRPLGSASVGLVLTLISRQVTVGPLLRMSGPGGGGCVLLSLTQSIDVDHAEPTSFPSLKFHVEDSKRLIFGKHRKDRAKKNHTVTFDQLSTATSMAEGPNAHVVEQRTMRPGAVVVATVVQRLLQTLELALLVVGVFPPNTIRQR